MPTNISRENAVGVSALISVAASKQIKQKNNLPFYSYSTPFLFYRFRTAIYRLYPHLRAILAPSHPTQGYVEATPEHPLEAASSAANFASSQGHGGGTSGADEPLPGRTFVTQEHGGGRGARSRSSLELLSEREIGREEAGVTVCSASRGDRGEGSLPASPRLEGVPHQPQAPLIV